MNIDLSLYRSDNHYEGVLSSLKPFSADLKSILPKIPSIVIKINLVMSIFFLSC